MALEQAGIENSLRSTSVDSNLRTSQRHICAAGDYIGDYQFTHYADWEGFMAVPNALVPGNKKAVLDQVPSATFTDPEVAHVGCSEDAARDRFGDSIQASTWPLNWMDRR